MTKNLDFPIRLDILLVPYIVTFVLILPLSIFLGLKGCFELYGVYLFVNLIFQSRLWQRLTGQSAWNIIPTYFVILPAIIYYGPLILLISWVLTKCFQKYMFLIMTATLSTIIYLFGVRVVAKTRYPRERRNMPPFVEVSNHSSPYDGAIMGFVNGNSKWTVTVKEEVMHIPPFSYFLDSGSRISL